MILQNKSPKRDKPYFSRHVPAFSKRRRPLPSHPSPPTEKDDKPVSKPKRQPVVVVTSLPQNCSVLDLKSRFEIYNSISRICINGDTVGYIAYRYKESAKSAIAASLDSSFSITVDSKRVQLTFCSYTNYERVNKTVAYGPFTVSATPASPLTKIVELIHLLIMYIAGYITSIPTAGPTFLPHITDCCYGPFTVSAKPASLLTELIELLHLLIR